jgi:exosome complex component RRP45
LFIFSEHIVIDPSYNEELIQKASVVTAVNAHREICCLSKVGGLELEHQKIYDCLSIAFVKYDQLFEVVDKKVKEDLKARDIQKSSLKGFK